MRVAMLFMRPHMAWPAKGSGMRSTMKIAMIFGTKTSVCSWICVSACRRPMTRPTASAVIMAGAAISSSTQMASRAKSIVSAGVMNLSLEWRVAKTSDRHLHDVLIGRDDLVADGDDRIEGELSGVDGIDDVDDV